MEEGSQEESREEMGIEVSQNMTGKKVGRKLNYNCRENEANKDKEIGIQSTLEEVFKKYGKGGNVPFSKGPISASRPSKGGASKSLSK
jgi:hypothetical protein